MKKIIVQTIIAGLLSVLIAMPVNAGNKTLLGKKAPEFALEDVKTGKRVRLSSFIGSRIVVINFWKSR